jgi:hypothetical protein
MLQIDLELQLTTVGQINRRKSHKQEFVAAADRTARKLLLNKTAAC